MSTPPKVGSTPGTPGSTKTWEPVLPLARIRRLIKSEGDVHQVSGEASFLVSRATELFLEMLTERSASVMLSESRTQLSYKDLAQSVSEEENLEFLQDVVPMKTSAADLMDSRAAKPVEG
mmetsp:Transcript_7023/g.8032  ORF Transcript_7023/g.8032 Transcript_7023/m.8032 type:complete len:120 (-) Transcript_7023:681-1040(-)|eukprot:CAMPEP_0197859624 /NCGR_PEP_ID=MMETSP1438-20131217/34347_1 /TAXON_ID=1461541 /ORGANISM="Pterosperma sp., Strain CCMP1384" /LENGTH=119 /DNA_ID=CAMNT_0043476185 /DNA_START=367 /DNA_END=726 /DNA_ORIENTATION=+